MIWIGFYFSFSFEMAPKTLALRVGYLKYRPFDYSVPSAAVVAVEEVASSEGVPGWTFPPSEAGAGIHPVAWFAGP